MQPEAGIVFGKLAAGQSVRISGRAERPIFFNSQNQTIAAQNLDGERYFAFINVEPGAHLVYLTSSIGTELAGVGIPVLGGNSTFVDMSGSQRVSMRGRVLDGGDVSTRPLGRVRVRILGKTGAEAETDSSGRFRMDDVVTIGSHPVFVETDAPSGYTHRYQIRPEQTGSVTLFRMDQQNIQTYLSQLEGAISPESGLILTALPNLINGLGMGARVMPDIKSLSVNPTLHPELYTISGNGQLQVGAPMTAGSSRTIAVQVPDGPVLMSLRNSKKNTVWSEIVISSPGVVSLIGPY